MGGLTVELSRGQTGCLQWASAGGCAPGERVCGDGFAVRSESGVTLVAVVDGLGHGPAAEESAKRALEAVARGTGAPADRVRQAHQELGRLRGAALGVLSIDDVTGALLWCGVGNVEAAVQPAAAAKWARLFIQAGLVGHRLPALRQAEARVRSSGLIVVSTDGVAPEFLESVGAGGEVSEL